MSQHRLLAILLGSLFLGIVATSGLLAEPAGPRSREDLMKLQQDGNFNEAYQGLRERVLDAKTEPAEAAQDLQVAVQCLQNLGRINELDEFVEQAVEVHAKNWRVLAAAAEIYQNTDHHGFIIAGKFERGQHRGGGRWVNSFDRDRVRALQLLLAAIAAAKPNAQHGELGDLHFKLAQALITGREYQQSWRLQVLTDLSALPDFEEGWFQGGNATGAPVTPDGSPVLYGRPRTFDEAKNDGERWRWALAEGAELAPSRRDEAKWIFAQFLYQQFGVQTLQQFSYFFGRAAEADGKQDESGTYALHTLGEDETIARLATGVKRFKLPEEFNYILLFQQLAAVEQGGYASSSLDTLAQIFEDRRQYPRAAEYWREAIKRFGTGNNWRQDRLDQIVGNWGRFEGTMTAPAGRGASLEFRFRNGKQVEFEAHEILVDPLLADVKAYLKSDPQQLDWQKLQLDQIGYRIVQQNEAKYLGTRVAQWNQQLSPRADHFDRRVTVTTPLSKAGAYLVTAKMADGNVSKIVVWIADTAIVKKPTTEGTYFYVGDAVSGAPIEKANVEFFGYRQEHQGNRRPRQFRTLTKDFAEFSGKDGGALIDYQRMPQDYNWLIIARTKPGRLAYLGFTGVWHGHAHDVEYNQTKVFVITDRPVYRPKQKVHFKFWVAQARFDAPDESPFAGQKFKFELHNPQGERIVASEYTADQYGGFDGEYELPEDAGLGVYQLFIPNLGGSSFRVEEYKKPEFEVTVDAPSEPVMLGDKITATVQAKYYFGSPVVNARVKYKVLRTSYTEQWYPVCPWDWLYGRGYCWLAYDYTWYPGWRRWGCPRPIATWWGRPSPPPELVVENDVAIGPDGKVEIEIDTELARLMHGDQDHKYEITAEVTDESRRTIVGSGNVLVARQPFKVFAWVDRGYYRVGETIEASFKAQTLDEKPVEGTGKARLLRITYDDKNQPVETPVKEWDLPTSADGEASLKITASQAGQYRLAFAVTDKKERTIEGAYLFTVTGEGFDGAGFRFEHLELIPDRREYAPGDKVKLMVNTDRAGGTVLLFVRPVNGTYLPPRVVRLQGKSTVVEIDVEQKDMPNFFVEAVTIADAKAHTELREIAVPPVKRVLNLAVTPSAKTYLPGEQAEVTIALTDLAGKPFVGSTVLTIYDKAVEYISGGSNVPEIREFFWKWKRSHYPRTETSLERGGWNLTLPDKPGMANLGVFGATAADEGPQEGAGVAVNGQVMDAMPVPAAAPMAEMAADGAVARGAGGAAYGRAEMRMKSGVTGQGVEAAPVVQPTIRKEFADTALWVGALETNKEGIAKVSLKMPENLTTWQIRAWAMGAGTRVGQGSAETVTRKNIIVRMQSPRFFVERDEVTLSANVHNYLKTAKQVEVVLELAGENLVPLGELRQTVEIPAEGEKRVDWRVRVAREGEAVIRMKALTDEESDAVEQRFPVEVHGMLKTESYSGVLRPQEETGSFEIRVPSERRINDSRLEIRYSPTLAGAMVDALPYLVSYPYGCTEQTLNRFLPTVVTQKILLDMQVDLKSIRDKQTNLNAQEIGDDRERASRWRRFDHNPVFDEEEVRRMVKAGLERLIEMQLQDGGWGWFSGFGERSTPHTTAYVVHGLQIARQNDLALVPGVLERGIEWLKNYQAEQLRLLENAGQPDKAKGKLPYKTAADNLDAFVYMVLVDEGVDEPRMREFLYRDRTRLTVYGMTLLGMSLAKIEDREKLDMVLRNISQFLVVDNENQTAYLKLPENNSWWFWYGSDIEANAYYLKLLARTDPKSEVAAGLVKYLLNNRRHGNYWNSTRDTSLVIEALADYLKASGEAQPDMTVEIWLDGKKRQEVTINAANLFTFDNKLVLVGDAVEEGARKIEFRKRGRGPLYYNAYLTNFTLEDPITAAGLEIKVERKFYRLIPEQKSVDVAGSRGQAVDQRVEKYRREELENLALLKSGDLVEIELEIESKNDYEYLLFEDMKAAGFEPVETRSGYNGNDLGAYIEMRDERVAFFMRWLARGKHSVSYRTRAEIPGRFSALPAKGAGMYAPELRANSNELKLRIEDK
ncbi:MAG: alpha-2-macroglobulin [Pirellulales bacterium]|nr:alpha-2-macroglobulin [Pirellulales bacterium]